MNTKLQMPHVVIIGGGFGGLYAAQALGHAPVKVTLIDKRNFHLFQPLLYQVATGGLSPGEVASPLRAVLNHHKNIDVLQAEVVDIDPAARKVKLVDGEVDYDTLIVSTGVQYNYFGNEQWADVAKGLKSIEDALNIRRKIFLAFEAAEREPDPEKRRAWLTFAIVGAGPTGVELAGTLGELAHKTLKGDFHHIDTSQSRILLIEAVDRVLPPFPADLSVKAARSLEDLGVTIRTNTKVTAIEDGAVTLRAEDGTEEVIQSQTILWAAGVKASPMGKILAERTGAELDRAGRVIVAPDLSIPGQPNIYVIGDLAHFAHQGDKPLPGVAQVAMQGGNYVARLIRARLEGRTLPAFHYNDKGNLAVIGRNAAVAELNRLHLSGFPAWVIWIFVHLFYLIEYDNRLLVLVQWAWSYFTRKRGARLITGSSPFPLVEEGHQPTEADQVQSEAVQQREPVL